VGIDLSILVCSTHTRWEGFGQEIQRQLWGQYAQLPEDYQSRVEIVMLTDNKKMMLGHKRNVMVGLAQGRYVQFVDDDDRIEPDMIRTVLDATDADRDVITFLALVSLNGQTPKTCRYSLRYTEDRNTDTGYERMPNHICAVKRDLATRVSFPHLPYGEDSGYAKLLRPLLRTETYIDRVLYHYDYNLATTETQQHLRNRPTHAREGISPVVDIVILSNAATTDLRMLTQATVDTCRAGSNGLPVGIAVLEQQPGVVHKRCATIWMDEPFHYNRFANFGARRGSADWILIANNDLLFHDGWLHQLIAADHPLVSPKCPRDSRQAAFTENTVGDITGQHLSGWCFMVSRGLWDSMGGFDEAVSFWCSDDVVIEQAKAQGVKPMIVPAAVVEHIQSVTLNTHPHRDDLTWKQVDIFAAKYGGHRLQTHPEYLRWKNEQSSTHDKDVISQ
jgi:GT2 family glycosyltransferase